MISFSFNILNKPTIYYASKPPVYSKNNNKMLYSYQTEEIFMNQEKIGKFISKCRKEKNLTQENLAEILGVSKNAVSKWERGICLMDMSLLKPLCENLDITINELLSGEKINQDEYLVKSEENIVNTIDYTNKKIHNKNLIIKSLIILFIIIIISILTIFIIDINRMRNNEEVFFSTWGIKYAPPINLDEEKIYAVIEDELTKDKKDNYQKHHNYQTFTSMKIYHIEELSNKTIYLVYLWGITSSFYEEDNQIIKDSASSIPYLFIIRKEDEEFKILNYQIPRDGSYYEEDMQNMFPKDILKDINKVHIDGTIEKLSFDIERQKNNYYND